MGRQDYNKGLADLRDLRAELAAAEKTVAAASAARDKLRDQRARKVMQTAAAFEGAKADAIAKAAGMSVGEVVEIAPLLDPTPAELRSAPPAQPEPSPAVTPQPEPSRPAAEEAAPAVAAEVVAVPPALDRDAGTPEAAAAPEPGDELQVPEPQALPVEEPPTAESPEHPAPADTVLVFRELPTIPAGSQGAAFTRLDPHLLSERAVFNHSLRSMVFLDAATGEMTLKGQTVRVQLGARTPGEILDAVQAAAPGTRRIYVTNGAPWHLGAERFPTLTSAVTWWLNTPSPRWTTAVGRGRDTTAGHFVHERHPVGRYVRVNAQPEDMSVEILSAGQWFDTGGADVAVVRQAFLFMYEAIRANKGWEKQVLLGFPSATALDLWRHTLPRRGIWENGYPVMSTELRELMHATAGQGRTELILPPRVPAVLPSLIEYDRIFAYAKHTWKSGVGAPSRLTRAAFAALSEQEQDNALMAPSHWNIKVTVPSGWQHIGLLPAPVPGERSWDYPARPGTTFTTWASGPEVVIARARQWHVEVLDGLVWKSGSPLKEWAEKLKATWAGLAAQAQLNNDPRLRQAYHLASRGIRSILLYGIGAFAQGPTLNSGFTAPGQPVPDGVEILTQDANGITWQHLSHTASDPHPNWSAGVWGAARAALEELVMKEKDETLATVGALHVPPGTVVAFRTDAIYLTQDPGWPSRGVPGDYLLKGILPGPVPTPTTVEELLVLRDRGRAHLAQQAA
ncbi:hypothetical protein ACIRPK_26690 [Kitasatospora sp. NPDC101801]|uniref:hypothetical protein n=1 Tax=Kitasatospora sp. NPDC101801 TaxID=3364103 RepID=UPI003800B035